MADSKYEVASQTIEVLLSPGTTQFEVPPFQRRYAWDSDEIIQLIDDIYSETSKTDLPYFLGSIVLAARDGSGPMDPHLVLDGQQRLTTLSLIISTLISRLKSAGVDDADENRMYLYSKRLKGKKKPKVILQDSDLEVFETLIDSPERFNEPKFKGTKISSAVGKIFDTIDKYKDKFSDGNDATAYQNMLERLLYDVEIVRIKAPSEKDAFRLFETLNDRGLALSAADLIKNKLFSHCGAEIDDALEAWSNMIALTKDDDVVNFLRHYWIASNGFARKRGLYDTYKNHIDKFDATTATLFAIELEESAKNYEQIINPNAKTCCWGQEVADVLERLNAYRSRSCRPAILACSKFSESNIRRIVDMCESISVRYSVIGERNPNQLETIYTEISRILRTSDKPLNEIRNSDFLKEIPSDDEIKAKLSLMEITSVNGAWREVLVMLNSALSTGETRIESPSKVHVEHILPQNPRATALTEASMTKPEALDYVNRLGNLTLLSGRRNREISNKPFSHKVSVYSGSEIAMTKKLTEYEQWGRDQINERTGSLAELVIKVFKHPKEILS